MFQGFLYAGGMLKNRYYRTDLFALVTQLGLRLKPQLELLDRSLESYRKSVAIYDRLARQNPVVTDFASGLVVRQVLIFG